MLRPGWLRILDDIFYARTHSDYVFLDENNTENLTDELDKLNTSVQHLLDKDALVFETSASMEAWLRDSNNKKVISVGTELLNKGEFDPDYWVTEVLENPDNETGYYYKIEESLGTQVLGVDDETITSEVDSDNETGEVRRIIDRKKKKRVFPWTVTSGVFESGLGKTLHDILLTTPKYDNALEDLGEVPKIDADILGGKYTSEDLDRLAANIVRIEGVANNAKIKVEDIDNKTAVFSTSVTIPAMSPGEMSTIDLYNEQGYVLVFADVVFSCGSEYDETLEDYDASVYNCSSKIGWNTAHNTLYRKIDIRNISLNATPERAAKIYMMFRKGVL